jgi:hypothetical protein
VKLIEAGPVAMPAYKQTSAAARTWDGIARDQARVEAERLKAWHSNFDAAGIA